MCASSRSVIGQQQAEYLNMFSRVDMLRMTDSAAMGFRSEERRKNMFRDKIWVCWCQPGAAG